MAGLLCHTHPRPKYGGHWSWNTYSLLLSGFTLILLFPRVLWSVFQNRKDPLWFSFWELSTLQIISSLLVLTSIFPLWPFTPFHTSSTSPQISCIQIQLCIFPYGSSLSSYLTVFYFHVVFQIQYFPRVFPCWVVLAPNFESRQFALSFPGKSWSSIGKRRKCNDPDVGVQKEDASRLEAVGQNKEERRVPGV